MVDFTNKDALQLGDAIFVYPKGELVKSWSDLKKHMAIYFGEDE